MKVGTPGVIPQTRSSVCSSTSCGRKPLAPARSMQGKPICTIPDRKMTRHRRGPKGVPGDEVPRVA
eukprot:scaffold434_cov186-Pinguiococcus_pyrenoidosus.AAC.23